MSNLRNGQCQVKNFLMLIGSMSHVEEIGVSPGQMGRGPYKEGSSTCRFQHSYLLNNACFSEYYAWVCLCYVHTMQINALVLQVM